MRDTEEDSRVVTYGDLLDWVHDTYPRLVKAHPLNGDQSLREPNEESELVVSGSQNIAIGERDVVAELRLFKKDHPT